MKKEDFQDITEKVIANASLSRLEERKYLARLQRENFLQDDSFNEKKDSLFKVENRAEATGVVTGDRYKIKKSLSTGTLRLGDKIVGATNKNNQLIVYPSPQGLQFPPVSVPKKISETTGLFLEIEIGFV